jgi:hypothetical protein
MVAKKQMNNESRTEAPNPQKNGAWFETPPWIYENQTTNDRLIDEHTTPILLNRLRELGIVQVAKKVGRVFFFPVHNPRPLCMYDGNDTEHPRFEWVQPHHVYETVNYLMWKRLLKPELALSFVGLFDSMPMPEASWGYHYGCLGDMASDYMRKWLSDAD